MNDKILLVKGITLLYKESLLPSSSESSKSLVNTLIQHVNMPSVNLNINGEYETLRELKEIAVEMVNDPIDSEYDPNLILQRIRLIPYVDEKTTKALEEGFKEPDNESNLKRAITILRKNINNYFREKQIEEILNKQAARFRHHRDDIKDVNLFIEETMAQLEPLQLQSSFKDPAIINEVDIGEENESIIVFDELKEINSNEGILKTGWKALNRMLQGGFRASEFTVISALPHMYKTGFTLSIFKQIALYNTPPPSNRKPLLLRISFEDELRNNLYFLYQNLKFNETKDPNVKIPMVTSAEMSEYVKNKLQATGFSVKMLRVDPTLWTYKDICNKVIEYEAAGYEIKLLMLDYLSMVPTTGCNTGGTIGTDIRELFRRIRNFCSPKKIPVITPHQLSTEAKNLARSGLPRENFVKEIAEKGYYSGSKQLDQEMDVDIYIDLVKANKETYLAVQRGKHRIPTIIDDEAKYFLLKFPHRLPIPDDILDEEDTSFTKPGQKESTDELFKI